MTTNFIFKKVTECSKSNDDNYLIESVKENDINCLRYSATITNAHNNSSSELDISINNTSCEPGGGISMKRFSLVGEPQYSKKDGIVIIKLKSDTADKDASAFLYQSSYNQPGDLINIWNGDFISGLDAELLGSVIDSDMNLI